MDQPTFETMIKTELGGTLVDVELTTTELTAAFNKAKATFIQKGNNNFSEEFVALAVDPTKTTYDLSQLSVDIDTIAGIVTPGFDGFNTTNLFTQATINDIFGGLISGQEADLVTYALTLQQLEFLRQITDSYPSFRFNRMTKTLKLNKAPPQVDTWLLHCWTNLTDDQYRDVLWIQEYTRAEAKIMLGYAYRKFSALSGPAGNVSLAGDQMVNEGKQEKKDLLQEILDFTDGSETSGYITLG